LYLRTAPDVVPTGEREALPMDASSPIVAARAVRKTYDTGSVGRILHVLVALALLTPTAAAGAAPADRVFTVAGGGDSPLLEGAPATEVRVAPTAVTVADDGTIVIVDHDRLWSVGLDGRVHLLDASLGDVEDVDAEPGGGLLAVSGGALYRQRARAADWEPVFTPPPAVAPALRAASAQRVTHSSDGLIVVGGTYLSWILEPDGRVVETLDAGGSEGVARPARRDRPRS
jgi:hypothetical protein